MEKRSSAWWGRSATSSLSPTSMSSSPAACLSGSSPLSSKRRRRAVETITTWPPFCGYRARIKSKLRLHQQRHPSLDPCRHRYRKMKDDYYWLI
ncbi:hypothetical protein MUK42_20332 [Musa troglodytarum]|uniref:Uncharacterized protein n=1 Tax=Musa troglodytarum TaxID=320322 RepID=A0A9E7GL60_9LILI|nr:hypothetical protein MUK42_20332 [Musa troglodytarum]